MFKKNLVDIEIEIIKDYEMIQRRAKILMQTCAHISGAGFFYDKKIIQESFKNDLNNNTKLKKVGIWNTILDNFKCALTKKYMNYIFSFQKLHFSYKLS